MITLDKGKGPAALLLHGTPAPSTIFSDLVAALAPTHRVLVTDLPGYLGEPALPGHDRFAQTTRALAAELKQRGVGETAIVGFSGGAYRAVALACEYPGLVSRLVLVAGKVQLDDAFRTAWRGLASVLRQGVDLRPTFPSSMLAATFAAAHPEAVAAVQRWPDSISTCDLADEVDSFAEAPDYSVAFSQLRIPITIRHGQLDQAVPVAEAEAAARLLPGVALQLVPSCGHSLLIEDREATIAAVVEALAAR